MSDHLSDEQLKAAGLSDAEVAEVRERQAELEALRVAGVPHLEQAFEDRPGRRGAEE